MIKDYFINSIENALENAVKNGKLGSMTEYERGTLKPERPKNAEFGDYAVNVSSLARFAKIAPPQIANAILECINKEDNEYTVVGTGPFHIGHGRWAAMGSVLANLLKFYGHEVYQEFYINDAGSQIQKLGNSLAIRIRQELGEDVDFPTDEEMRKNYYPGDYLIPVAKKYLETHNGLPKDVKELSDFAKKEMEDLQKALLDNFRVTFDNFYSELTLHNSGKVESKR